ncbi:esterase [Yokenella regensburgei]|uniref:esterase n=1 Tax=Yokenella regensburgei TaxID=158877 RepID=UPI003F18D459
MIELNVDYFAGIETLHAFPAGKATQPLPTIIFYHGFLSSKLVYSYFAVALAQAGFRVIMPDAPLHGARFNHDENGRLQQFWQILQSNFTEFPALRDALYQADVVEGDRLAVGGASMGGMTALGIMTHHPEVRSVACLMGSGYFSTLSRTLFPPVDVTQPAQKTDFDAIIAPLAQWDATTHLPQLGNRPLLLWHGEDDDVVPAAETVRLQQALAAKGGDNQLTFLLEPGVRHRITPTALEATVAFFTRSL